MGKPRLILHIGVHKTGTTALQDILEQNRETLSRQAMWYARTDRPPFPEHAKHGSLFRAALRGGEDLLSETRILSEEFRQSGCTTLVLSEEGFSEPRFSKFAALADFLAAFEVKIYCNIRRQDYLIESLWNQHCKFRDESRGIEDFAFDPEILNRCRFKPLLDFWSSFGEIVVRDYDQVKLSGTAHTFGETFAVVLPETMQKKNLSPSANCALVLAELNRLGLQELKPKVIRAFRNDTRKHALGGLLRQRLLNYFQVDNAAVAKTYGVTFETTLPSEGPEPIRHLETTAVVQAMARMSELK